MHMLIQHFNSPIESIKNVVSTQLCTQNVLKLVMINKKNETQQILSNKIFNQLNLAFSVPFCDRIFITMNRSTKLSLYKNILRAAQSFPSVKRNGIIDEIRVTFRANMKLTDENEINKCLSVAVKGLSQLSMYSNLPRKSTNWTVNLEQEPMPRRN